MAKKESQSRPARWARACDKVREGVDELKELFEEYRDWLDNMPEQLQDDSPTGAKLQELMDWENTIDETEDNVNELEGVELPRGWGKD